MMGFPYTPGRVAGWCELAGELSHSEESRTGLSRATLLRNASLRNASEPWVASRRVVRDPNPLLQMFGRESESNISQREGVHGENESKDSRECQYGTFQNLRTSATIPRQLRPP